LAANERQLVILPPLLGNGIIVVGYISDVLDNFLLRYEGIKLRLMPLLVFVQPIGVEKHDL
jgi:hypothetical protein